MGGLEVVSGDCWVACAHLTQQSYIIKHTQHRFPSHSCPSAKLPISHHLFALHYWRQDDMTSPLSHCCWSQSVDRYCQNPALIHHTLTDSHGVIFLLLLLLPAFHSALKWFSSFDPDNINEDKSFDLTRPMNDCIMGGLKSHSWQLPQQTTMQSTNDAWVCLGPVHSPY